MLMVDSTTESVVTASRAPTELARSSGVAPVASECTTISIYIATILLTVALYKLPYFVILVNE